MACSRQASLLRKKKEREGKNSARFSFSSQLVPSRNWVTPCGPFEQRIFHERRVHKVTRAEAATGVDTLVLTSLKIPHFSVDIVFRTNLQRGSRHAVRIHRALSRSWPYNWCNRSRRRSMQHRGYAQCSLDGRSTGDRCTLMALSLCPTGTSSRERWQNRSAKQIVIDASDHRPTRCHARIGVLHGVACVPKRNTRRSQHGREMCSD